MTVPVKIAGSCSGHTGYVFDEKETEASSVRTRLIRAHSTAIGRDYYNQ